MAKVLVSGGLGYIGSHTVVELLDKGFDVLILDDLSNSEYFILDSIKEITDKSPEFEKIDLKDFDTLRTCVLNYKPDGIIHFAASKAVGESIEKPLLYYKNNLTSLINLLEVMEEAGLDHFIFSSSATVYGQADKMPITEDFEWKPATSPYAKTKQMGEEILMDFSSSLSKKVITLRYFNPIGAHKSGKIGELPRGIPNNLVPFVSQTAAGVRKELKIFGNDYNTPDGTAIRDYIDITDLAKAHTAAMKKVFTFEKPKYEIFNLGTGKGSSVLEVVKTFEEVNQLKLPYSFAPRREGDITEAYADSSKAEKELNWKAEASLGDALSTTWEWEKNIRSQQNS